MPIISEIGKRSWRVRLLYAIIYTVLIIGAVTMIYPLLLMLSGSVKSEADSWSIKPYPEFWFDDLILFQKYTESKYNVIVQEPQQDWCKPVMSWRTIEKPAPVSSELIRDFRNWRAAIPPEQRRVGQVSGGRVLPKNLRSYRSYMSGKYRNDLAAYNLASNQLCTSWSNVKPPTEIIGRYRNLNLSDEFRKEMIKWAATLPASELIVDGARGQYALGYLYGIYTSRIEAYNQAHGTAYESYSEIPFLDHVPVEKGL
jgi:multiple sugar transport system permease protein